MQNLHQIVRMTLIWEVKPDEGLILDKTTDAVKSFALFKSNSAKGLKGKILRIWYSWFQLCERT